MKYGIVRPHERMFSVVDAATADDAKIVAGLNPSRTDHGRVWTGLGMICDEHALFVHPQFYFSINRRLYGGNVVLYAYDGTGKTIDFDVSPARWFGEWIGDENDAERAIKAGRVERPQLAVGDKVFWSWPRPMPDMSKWAGFVAAEIAEGQSVLIDGDTLITPLDPPQEGKK